MKFNEMRNEMRNEEREVEFKTITKNGKETVGEVHVALFEHEEGIEVCANLKGTNEGAVEIALVELVRQRIKELSEDSPLRAAMFVDLMMSGIANALAGNADAKDIAKKMMM